MRIGKHLDITYRRHRYQNRELEREEEEEEELVSEQDTMGDQENHEFNSFVNILNDLAKGQKTMMELMG